RIGFRGTQEFKNFGPAVIWQIESGNAADAGESGSFGVRDSFIGLQFEHGKFRYGRLTTPAYDIVDWPYTNPGLGAIFDWNTDIAAGAHLDRVGNHFRWDSKNYNGFTYQLSAGQAQGDVKSAFYSAAAHFTKGIVTLHAGYQYEGERAIAAADVGGVTGVTADRSFYIVGGELNFANGFALKGAFKHMNSDYDHATADGVSQDQNAYSITAEYTRNSWLYKLGYAGTTDLKSSGTLEGTNISGTDKDVKDKGITARVMYFLDPSAVIYSDIRHYNFGKGDVGNEFDAKDQTRYGVGIEYYF
ncbi:MAG: porin, partial [Enterovibrio sp.]